MLWSVFEVVAVVSLFFRLILGIGSWASTLVVILVFSILTVSLANRKGIISVLLDRRIFYLLGRYAYSIYVMQQISFYLLRDSLWRNAAFLTDHFVLSIALSVLAAAVVGALTYHFIEAPAVKVYGAWKNRHRRDAAQ